jgi:hypothetical protein
MKKLTVLHARVGEEPAVVTIDNDLESLKSLVGGWIETVRLPDDILMVVNEEGMLHDLPLNFITFVRDFGTLKPVHEIAGDVFFVSTLGENFISLDKEQIQKVKGMFSNNRNALIVR